METFISGFIEKAPYLGGFIAVVWMFLRHLRFREENLQMISQTCHDVSRSAIEAIKENSRLLGANHAVLERVNNQLIRLNGNK